MRLITARTYDRNVSSVFIIRSFQNCLAVNTAPYHRSGAGGARGAHNSEVTGSNPVSGIFQFAVFRTAKLSPQQHFTGMAQRQRAGLITPRSLDRNGLPVFSNSLALQKLVVKMDVKRIKSGVNLLTIV